MQSKQYIFPEKKAFCFDGLAKNISGYKLDKKHFCECFPGGTHLANKKQSQAKENRDLQGPKLLSVNFEAVNIDRNNEKQEDVYLWENISI